MVSSIIGSGQSQVPASRAFDVGQAPSNPVDPNQRPQQVARAPEAVKAPDTSVSPGKTEEINEKLALSRDVSRVNPSQISSNTQARGTLLDIVI